MTGAAVVPIPGRAFITGRTLSLSLRYVCIAMPIWRRLLKSFVTFARSRALLKAGTAIPTRMAMIAITTSISMSVKAREYFFFIGGISLGSDTVLGLSPERKRKIGQKQDCLTIRWPFCLRRSCQIKSLFHLH